MEEAPCLCDDPCLWEVELVLPEDGVVELLALLVGVPPPVDEAPLPIPARAIT